MNTLENTKNQFQTRIGTVLVTGATGFIGHNLVRQLVKQGHRVFALVRKTSNVNLLKELGVSLIYGDITDSESLNKVLGRKIDIIFHCAALVDNTDKNKLYKINVEGTRNICNLALGLKVERMVYISSVAVVSGNLEVP
ncbi:SDR family NAD(P)-dependent oxidoreductase, partial [bacterium]